MPVLSKIHPVKCLDFAKRRRFPVRFPRFTVIFFDFQRNNTQAGDYHKTVLVQTSGEFGPAVRVVAHADDERVTFLVETDRLSGLHLALDALDSTFGGTNRECEQKDSQRLSSQQRIRNIEPT